MIDELVCVARRVETPFARGSNATLRVTFSGVDARSVDNSSRVADLKKCWASFNTPPNQKYAFIAKRIVAREMVVELCFEGDARAEAAAAAVRNAAEIAFAPTTIRIAPPGTGHDEPPVLDMDPCGAASSHRWRRAPRRRRVDGLGSTQAAAPVATDAPLQEDSNTSYCRGPARARDARRDLRRERPGTGQGRRGGRGAASAGARVRRGVPRADAGGLGDLWV